MYTSKDFKHKDFSGKERMYIGYLIHVMRYFLGYKYFVVGVRVENVSIGDYYYFDYRHDSLIGFDTLEEAYEYVDALPELEVAE